MLNEGSLKQIESQIGFTSGAGPADLGSVVSNLLKYALSISGIALLIYFIYGGFQLFTSGGDQKKVAEGKSTITNALIGFVVVFVAFWIAQLFGNVLGLQPLIGSGGLFSQ